MYQNKVLHVISFLVFCVFDIISERLSSTTGDMFGVIVEIVNTCMSIEDVLI